MKDAKVDAEAGKKVDGQGPPPPYSGPHPEGDGKASGQTKKDPTAGTSESEVSPLNHDVVGQTKKEPTAGNTQPMVSLTKPEDDGKG